MNNQNKADKPDHISREKLEHGGQLHSVHWLILISSAILTLGAWYFSSEQLSQKNEAKFQREADQVLELVQERMKLYENALWGGVALIDSNGGAIFYDRWLSYANSLQIDKEYPGINGIGVIYNVQPDQLADYLVRERTRRPDYSLHPQHSENEYWPITYIEPAGPNKKAVGLDMAFETNRYTGIKKARDLGEAQVTGPITLVQDSKNTPGFLFYTPFYKNGNKPDTIEKRRQEIAGVTYAPFIMAKLMQGTLSSQKRLVSVKISDSGNILFDDENIDQDKAPLFSRSVDMAMYGRTWSFDIDSSLGFRTVHSSNQPYWILFGGLIIDGLLLGLFISLTRVNRIAIAYADQTTKALKTKTIRLEKSNEDLEQFSYVASHDLRAPLNAINQVVGWISEDCADILPDESLEHLAMLKNRSERLKKLLEDLLRYSQINRFDYKDENVNLAMMADDVLSLIDIEDKTTCTAPDIDITLPRIPLEITIRNLMTNAIKHNDKETCSIEITYSSTDTDHHIHILDDGPGIPDDMHAQVMEMFRTLKPRDQVEGSGMGLAMVKKIIEYHHGKLTLEQGRERGTHFTIIWPKHT